jgi:hypothetical protein
MGTLNTSGVETFLKGAIDNTPPNIPNTVRAGMRVKAYIRNASQQHLKIPLVYRDTLSSLLTIFGKLKYLAPNGKAVSIKCVHGNPERIAAKMTEQTNLVLPIISITQTTSEDDVARRRYEPTIVHQKYWDKNKERAIRVLSLAPKAINISYSINIWSKYRADMDQILEQIRLMFNPELRLETSTAQNTKAFLTTEADNSDVATGDKEDRVLKRGVTIEVQTYLPNPKFLITSTGQIEEFKVEYDVYSNNTETTTSDIII